MIATGQPGEAFLVRHRFQRSMMEDPGQTYEEIEEGRPHHYHVDEKD
jgi:hypothetical protein